MTNQSPVNNRTTHDIAALCGVSHSYVVEMAAQRGYIEASQRELTPQQASGIIGVIEEANALLASYYEPDIDVNTPIFSVDDIHEMMQEALNEVSMAHRPTGDTTPIFSVNDVRDMVQEVLGR